ncbi:helix-turn-helix domain-containing protein [Planococcus sp. FY231025]|uniref:helix-turn-helix domain-containing protein n=1 Tax=Planococcus sp. FY231025 TaxID=3455699 RepID=UPI003F8FFC55
MEDFAKLLIQLRKEKKKSIRKLAEEADISHTYLSTLERGFDPRSNKVRKPAPEILKRLAAALGVEYSTLLHEAGYEELYKAEKYKEAIEDFEEKDSFFELFNFGKPSLNGFIEEQNGIKVNAKNFNFPVNDLFFHLTDANNKKMYKTIILSDSDRSKIKSLIENYLIQKLSNGEEDNRHLIKILVDENFTFPSAKKD